MTREEFARLTPKGKALAVKQLSQERFWKQSAIAEEFGITAYAVGFYLRWTGQGPIFPQHRNTRNA